MNPLHLDATAQAELIRKKQISPWELTEMAIAAIEKLNPQLNAVINPLFDRARQQITDGLPGGPFRGVPFLLKDGVATLKGVATMSGTKLFALAIAQEDSELVKRYKEAGLVILGKTNMPELGLLPTTQPRSFGATHNPWKPGHTPGGSSGGSSAAVAARMVAMAHANDGGGSIRIPASCCGLFGLKPTRGRNPLGPIFGELIGGLVEEHVVSRSVRDSAAMLDATSGPDVGALYHAPLPKKPFAEAVKQKPGKLRIGYCLETPFGREPHEDCRQALEHTIRLLEKQGHELVPKELPTAYSSKRTAQIFTLLWAVGATSALSLVERFTKKDLNPKQVEPLTYALFQIAKNTQANEYEGARIASHRIVRAIGGLFTEIDAWLSPTLALPPPPLENFEQDPGEPLASFRYASAFAPYNALFNLTGQPAATLPMYWNEEGLPIGVQLVGRFGDEETLFQLAAQLEAAQNWQERLPEVCV
jgi:amidase